MKKVIRTLAALSAAIIATVSVTPFRNTVLNNIDDEKIVYAAENGSDLLDSIGLPEWIPKSFDEAAAFEEKYGRTHTGDGFVCVFFRKKADEQFHAAYTSAPKKFTDTSGDFIKISYEIPSEKTEEPGTIYEDGKYIAFIFRFKGADYLNITDEINKKIYRFIADENGEPVETKPVAGDYNGNGIIESSDVLMLQKAMVLANKNSVMPFYFDMNDDGKVNIADLCLMKDTLMNSQ